MIYHAQVIMTTLLANDAYFLTQRPQWRAKAANLYRDDKIAAAKYLAMLRAKASDNRRQLAIKKRAARVPGVFLDLRDIP